MAGGGTAGWLAAAALSRQLGQLLDVVLVESDEIGTVGVGEATIPTIRSFHAILGLDERAFMAATSATFKLGISFENWARPGDRYIHSFGTIGRSTWMGDFHHFWLEARARGFGEGIGAYCLEHEAALACRFATGGEPDLSYAYHLDAARYACFLRQESEAAGVTRIEGHINQVRRDPATGHICSLLLDGDRQVTGDLFLDCTGFRGLLIGEAMEVPFDDWGQWLATNRALAVQTPMAGPVPPYTQAIAHDAGWRWCIPLQHRVGNGLVYASDHLSDDEAHGRLLAAVEGEPLTEPRLIRYRTGCRQQAWRGNCIALGLSAGFVEPLESTSIHLVMIGLTRLMQLFPFSGISDSVVRRFNDQSHAELERVRDFVILHYKLTERDDTGFWRQCRDMEIPDTLAERIALFRASAQAYQGADELFRVDSWVQVMLGQGLSPVHHHQMARIMGEARLREVLGRMRAGTADAVRKLPTHQQFLERYAPAEA